MTDKRTPDQRAADDALTTAIDQARRAYFPDSAGRLLTDYVVTAAEQSFDAQGNPELAFATLVRDGQQATHHTIGLLTLALDNQRAHR